MRRVIGSLLLAAGFVIVLPLLVAVIYRLGPFPYTTTKALIETLLPLLLLPAYVVLIGALLAQRRLLSVIALAVITGHIITLVPEVRTASPLPPTYTETRRISILSHNMHYDNWDKRAFAEGVRSTNADIVFLQEYSLRDFYQLEEHRPFENYRYSYSEPTHNPKGLAIFSKFPLSSTELIIRNGFPQMRAVADVDGRQVILWNVHVNAPTEPPITKWEDDLKLLRERLLAERGDVIVAGDFNATFQHRPFRQLVSNGYREAARDRGRWYARTWPESFRGRLGTGGIVRLDHVLTRGAIRPITITEGPPNGSDHLTVRSTIALY